MGKLYRIYIDEVGNHDMSFHTVTNLNQRYLTLFGVIVERDYMLHTLQPAFNEIKRAFFQHDPDIPIIFHRKDMVKKRDVFRKLWEKEVCDLFDQQMLQAYEQWLYTALGVTIDKKQHLALYGEWYKEPYEYCLQVLVERYILFLKQNQARGDVMIEARGKREDKILKQAYSNFFLAGSGYISAQTWQKHLTTKQIKINPKRDNVCGLQLADLLAHAAHYDILQAYGHVEQQKAPYGRKIAKILRQSKYHRSQTGQIKGYGMKLLPGK